jgi:hypothetical protein
MKYIGRRAHNTGFLVGSYNNVGANGAKTNPIYTIGSGYMPADSTLGNMYGIGGPGEGKDANAAAFVNKLTNFINKDISKHRPKERVYETQEFKDKHNYAEYNKLNKERFDVFRAIMRAKDEDEKAALRKQKSVLEDEISNTEYAKAMRAADKEYDRQVDLYHNTPLSKQDLSDDGSPQYRDMEQAYNKLIGKVSIETDEDVIDV